MSGGDDLVAWLRAQVEARLALAREASSPADGHWWRRIADAGHFDDGTLELVGPLYAGEPVLDADGDVYGGEEIVVYDEGRPSDVQFDHIAASDPQDTIARCEAELAILDEHRGDPSNWGGYRPDSTWQRRGLVCMTCGHDDGRLGVAWPCRTIRLLASGYRHWPGYQEEQGGKRLP